MFKRFLLLICLALFVVGVNAQQLKTFGATPLEYQKTFKEFVDKQNTKENTLLGQKYLEGFTKSLSAEQQIALIDLSNRMLAKRMTYFPYFQSLQLTMVNLYASQSAIQHFDEWMEIADSLVGKQPKEYNEYLKATTELFKGNFLFNSNRHKWYFTGDKYDLKLDKAGKITVVIPQTTIVCSYNTDSVNIAETEGICYLMEQKFVGDGGKVDWRRVNFPDDSIFVRINKYDVSMLNPGFECDSVYLFVRGSSKQTLGRFADKASPGSKPNTAQFPQFYARETRSTFNDVYPGIDYYGQYSLQGSRYLALGTKENPATLTIRKDGRIVLRAKSQSFAFSEKLILSDQASVAIYLQSDSIYHPGLAFNYTVANRKLLLFQEPKALNKSMFTDSYHQVDIDVESLVWPIDSSTIQFRRTSGLSEATADFQSVNFYSLAEYDGIAGVTSAHPLKSIRKFAQQQKSNSFNADQFAQFLKIPAVAVKELLVLLSREGYISYDRSNETVTIRKKMNNYIDAHDGKIDYDIIRLRSTTLRQENGELNLNDNFLRVNGVKVVFLSDSHSVYIKPRGNFVKIGKNRSMVFEGQVHAGPLDFFGDGFTFDYENFKIKMANVDSLKFRVYTEDRDINGRRGQYDLKTVFEKINGELLIDEPTNKAGLVDKPSYPIFKSNSSCFVYYERENLYESCYKRDKFYFKVDPFIMDSLDLVNTKRGYDFPGTLVSGGIFPDIKETLVIQPDTSLGFVRIAPTDGYPAYGGKGRYFEQVVLNNQGLNGKGKLTYLSTTTTSDKFLFMLDSMNTISKHFSITKGRYGSALFPKVEADATFNHWLPYQDTLFVNTRTKSAELFGENANLSGQLIITPGGMRGEGDVSFGTEKLSSTEFRFTDTKLYSPDTKISINSLDPQVLAFQSGDINSSVDFESKKGVFKANNDRATVTMGYNNYETELKEFYWDLTAKEVTLGSKNASSAETHFISTNPDQNGFEFDAKYAIFDLKKYMFDARGVQKVKSADAFIYPDSQQIVVEKAAKIRPLKNAVIVLDTNEEMHRIYEADVKIDGRLKYTGSGKYDYKNLTDSIQKIYFQEVLVNKEGVSEATSAIGERKPFFLNPGFYFNGTINLAGGRKELLFAGLVTLPDLPKDVQAEPFKIHSLVDPKTPYIKVDSFLNQSGERLIAGFVLAPVNGIVYPIMLQKQNSGDSLFFQTTGMISFNKATKSYTIGSPGKLLDKESKGSYMEFNYANKLLTAEGKIDLTSQNDPKFLLQLGGKITYTTDKKVLNMEVAGFIEPNMLPEFSKYVSTKVFDNSGELEDQSNDGDVTLTGLAQLVPAERWAKDEEEIKLYSTIPDKGPYKKWLVITSMKLTWDETTRSFKSVGPIGIANLNGQSLNKKVPGKFEVNYGFDYVMLNFALEPEAEKYYLLTYRKNMLELIGSDMDYINLINSKLLKKKKGTASDFILGNTQTYDELLMRVGK